MKKLSITIIFLSIVVSIKAQHSPIRANTIVALVNLQPPGDTLVAPTYIGELRYKTSDSTLYCAKSLSGASKWTTSGGYFLVQNTGGGNSVINPNTTVNSWKFKTLIAGGGIYIYPTDSTIQISQDITDINITTGTSTTLGGSQYRYNIAINPPSVMSTYTINFPASPSVGTTVELSSGGTMTSGTTVTTLIINGNGHTIIGTNPTTLTAGSATYKWNYNFSSGFWYVQ